MTRIKFPLGGQDYVATCDNEGRWTVNDGDPPDAAQDILDTFFGEDWERETYEPFGSWGRARAAIRELKGEIVFEMPPPGSLEPPDPRHGRRTD